MKTKLMGSGLGLLLLALFWVVGPGCKVNTPSAAVMNTQTCPPFLFDGFESLSSFSTLGGTGYVTGQGITLNAPTSGVTYNSTLSLSNLNATQGSHSLDVDITTAVSYNQNILVMTGFLPTNWSNAKQLVMDLTVDPSVVAGATYGSFIFVADSSLPQAYFQFISSSTPNLSAGSQSVTFDINFSAGTLPPNAALAKLTFIYNRSNPGPGQGIGNIYVDNMRLVYGEESCGPLPTATPGLACTAVPTSTPALVDDMEDNNNQILANECRNGYWYAYNDGSAGGVQKTGTTTVTGSSTFAMASGGVGYGCTGTSSYAAEVSTNSGFTIYGGGFGCNIYVSSTTPFNAKSYGYTGIEFCARNTTGALSPTFMLQEQVPTTIVNPSGSGVTVLTFQTTNSMTPSWAQIQVPFSGVTFTSSPSLSFDSTALYGMQWQVNASTTTDIWIDNIQFY